MSWWNAMSVMRLGSQLGLYRVEVCGCRKWTQNPIVVKKLQMFHVFWRLGFASSLRNFAMAPPILGEGCLTFYSNIKQPKDNFFKSSNQVASKQRDGTNSGYQATDAKFFGFWTPFWTWKNSPTTGGGQVETSDLGDVGWRGRCCTKDDAHDQPGGRGIMDRYDFDQKFSPSWFLNHLQTIFKSSQITFNSCVPMARLLSFPKFPLDSSRRPSASSMPCERHMVARWRWAVPQKCRTSIGPNDLCSQPSWWIPKRTSWKPGKMGRWLWYFLGENGWMDGRQFHRYCIWNKHVTCWCNLRMMIYIVYFCGELWLVLCS